MSLFVKRIIGLEISKELVGGALLRGARGLPLLEQTAFETLPPDTISISRRKPHLSDPSLFVQKVSRIKSLLQTDVSSAALSLPDAAGRVVLMDLDETWKNRDEAAEMILWKLKKNMPHEPLDLHLDFQILLKREAGPSLVLAALVARPVVEQYENLLHESGFETVWIGMNQISLVRAFAGEIADEGARAFVSWYGENLGIIMIHDGIPVFWRSKYLPAEVGDGERIDQELHGSIEAYNRQWPDRTAVKAYFFAPCDRNHAWYNLLSSMWEQPPVLLDYSSLYRKRTGTESLISRDNGVIAAIAAAAGRL